MRGTPVRTRIFLDRTSSPVTPNSIPLTHVPLGSKPQRRQSTPLVERTVDPPPTSIGPPGPVRTQGVSVQTAPGVHLSGSTPSPPDPTPQASILSKTRVLNKPRVRSGPLRRPGDLVRNEWELQVPRRLGSSRPPTVYPEQDPGTHPFRHGASLRGDLEDLPGSSTSPAWRPGPTTPTPAHPHSSPKCTGPSKTRG